MSAYMVSKTHIDALITAGLRLGRHGPMSWYLEDETKPGGYERFELRYENASETGMMLWAENMASINARYPDTIDHPDCYPGPADFEPDQVLLYSFEALPGHPDAVDVLKAISCYEYQTCEHDGWKTSNAKAFCDALQAWAISALKGYDDSKGWDIYDRHIWSWVGAA